MSESLPLVTIAVPMYNAAATIRETLESLLSQTYPNLEIVLMDNDSTDRTLEVIAATARGDSRVSVVRNERNIGSEANSNRCLLQGTGKYLALFHADDLYLPELIARQVEFLEANPEAGAVFPRAIVFDPQGERRRSLWLEEFGPPVGSVTLGFERLLELTLRHGNALLTTPGFTGRRSVIAQCAGFDFERFRTSADLGMWLEIAQRSCVGLLAEPLMKYRISARHGSVLVNHKRTGPADFFRVTEHHLAARGGLEGLSREVRAGYRAFVQEDALLRSLALVVQGQPREARAMLVGVPSADALACFLARPGGLKVVGMALLMRLAFGLGVGPAAGALIYRLRYGIAPGAVMTYHDDAR